MGKERLGLNVEVTAAQTVKITFLLVDNSDPSKEYSFLLSLGPACDMAESYSVSSCTPLVSNVRALVETLNSQVESAAALPAFVCAMKKAFQSIAREGKGV